MGMFWDLIQQSQISSQSARSDSVEDRVGRLEAEVRQTQMLVRELLELLEKELGRDIDGDGRVG